MPEDSQKAKLMNSRRLALLSSGHAAPLQLFVPSSRLFDRPGARNEIASFEAKRYSEMNGPVDKDIETMTLISGQEAEREHHSPRRTAQLLLSAGKRGLRLAAVASIAGLIALLYSSTYREAKTGLAQIVRQSAWQHALSGEPPANPWPWDSEPPAGSPKIVRLGLSAAVNAAVSDDTLDRRKLNIRRLSDRHDPHLIADDVTVGGRVTVTHRERQVCSLWGRPLADPHLASDIQAEGGDDVVCAQADTTKAGPFRRLIEATNGAPKATFQTDSEQKL